MEPPSARLIPELTGSRIVVWIDSRRVIYRPIGSHANDHGLDLETGKAVALPGRRPTNYGVGAPRSEFEHLSAVPSPDGRWLLYPELGNSPDDNPRSPARLRLSSFQGSPDRLIVPRGFTLALVDSIVWLPDSRGWIVVRCGPNEPAQLTLHMLRAPNASRLLRPRGLPDHPAELERNWVVRMTTRGELAMSDPADWRRLHYIDVVHGNRVRSVYLRTLADKWGEHPPQDDLVLPMAQLSSDGQQVLAGVREGEKSWSVWRFPVDGAPAERLFSLAGLLSGLSVSPDGRILAFRESIREDGLWRPHTSLVTLPVH